MWQICPLCKGTGKNSYASQHNVDSTCSVCNGEKIISELTGLPPSRPLQPPVDPTGPKVNNLSRKVDNPWQPKENPYIGRGKDLQQILEDIKKSQQTYDNERTVYGPPDSTYKVIGIEEFFSLLHPKEQDEINKTDKI